jgi:hypothetical protein
LLAHFLFNKPLNFPFYFLKILEKMSSQVRKNVNNPRNSLFHHGLIKLLVLAELEKQGKNWDAFIYQFANPHLTVKTDKKPLSLKTISPSKPLSPRTPNPLSQTLSLPKQYQNLVDILTYLSGKKTKRKDQKKPIVNPPMPSLSLDPTPKQIQEVIQQDFPNIPTKKRGANRFGKGTFRKSTQSTRTKPYAKPPPASDPIQVSSNLESPHKKLREVSADGLEPLRKTKSKPTSPYQSPITPTSPMPNLDPKIDRLCTSLKGSKISLEITDSTPTIEELQKENHQLLQQLEERKTIDTHLHHDNAILQEKVNSLQQLVNEMTKSNRSLRAQLKKYKRCKAKSLQQEGEASKPYPPHQT